MPAPQTVMMIGRMRLRMGPNIGASVSRLDRWRCSADTCALMAPRIAAAGPERIDELRPLWLQLHHDAQGLSPVQPFVDDETSWARRRQSYVDTFDGGGFALVAEDDGLV